MAEPDPDVARIRVAITNIKPSRPGVSAVTSIIPIGLGVSLVKKRATGGWTGSGETAAEMQVLDSITNKIIAMGVDQRKAAFEERFSKWGSATEAFKFWAERRLKTSTRCTASRGNRRSNTLLRVAADSAWGRV